jgi:hypothetical protein
MEGRRVLMEICFWDAFLSLSLFRGKIRRSPFFFPTILLFFGL